jgi:hypothetical protein
MTPIPFHCHDCEAPTMNKNGLCDDHQPHLPERAVASKKANSAERLGEAQTIKLSDLSQSE